MKHIKGRKWLFASLAVVLLIAAALGGGWLYLLSRYGYNADAGWPDDERLTLEPFVKPQVERNALELYEEAFQIKREAERSSGGYMGGPRAELDAYARQQVLAKIHEAVRLPYISPTPADMVEFMNDQLKVFDVDFSKPPGFNPFFGWRELGRLIAETMGSRLQGGDSRGVLALGVDGLCMGAQIPWYGNLAELLQAQTCARTVSPPATRALLRGDLRPDVYRAYALAVRRARDSVCPFGLTLRFEWEQQRSMLVLATDEEGRLEVAKWALFPEEMIGDDPPVDLPFMDRLKCRAWLSGWELTASQEWLADRYARLIREAEEAPGGADLRPLCDQTAADLQARREPSLMLLEAYRNACDTWLD